MIDHLFFFIEGDGPEIAALASLGLIETYRRAHTGQGTQNICYCFDNLYLELLWVDDRDAVRSDPIQRTGLYQRSLWQTNGACPFGIAVRKTGSDPALPFPTWDFTPPYLPKGISIPVATDSDDPRQPLIFISPGARPPIEWPEERRGTLQHSARLGAVTGISLTMPADASSCNALTTVTQSSNPPLRTEEPGPYSLQLRVASLGGKPELEITLPLTR